MLFMDTAVEVCMDDDRLHVGNDQKGGIVQRDGIALELNERSIKIFVLALVLPGKATLFPDIGPSLATPHLAGTHFEGVPCSVRVGFDWCLLPDQGADIIEVGLGSRTFFQIRCKLPLCFEFSR